MANSNLPMARSAAIDEVFQLYGSRFHNIADSSSAKESRGLIVALLRALACEEGHDQESMDHRSCSVI